MTPTIQRTFNADAIEDNFEKYGYTIIRNFINKEEIQELRNLYEANKMDNTNRSFFIQFISQIKFCSKQNCA